MKKQKILLGTSYVIIGLAIGILSFAILNRPITKVTKDCYVKEEDSISFYKNRHGDLFDLLSFKDLYNLDGESNFYNKKENNFYTITKKYLLSNKPIYNFVILNNWYDVDRRIGMENE